MKQTATVVKARSARKPQVPREFGFRQILAPTDFSENSAIAVGYAVELARRLGAKVILLHIIPEPSALDYTMGGLPPGEWEQAQEEARKKLDQEWARARATYERVDSLLRTGLGLHEQIVGAVRETSADLIVISTHGYTGWKHFLFGSDAERFLHEILCPIVVVR
ncbi:MAG: universal stress protein [Verrucomicrobia bacterium]|nr:universal stress protein [Verrucomicrobiota bacterium]